MTRHLAVNPVACDGHGMCAELLPEFVRLDDWGYPIIDPAPIPLYLEDHARRAVAACPTLALLIRERQDTARPPARRRRSAPPGDRQT